jgi:nitric oxide reductase subunit B
VVVGGPFVLVLLAYRTYESDPPIPTRRSTGRERRHTGDDVSEGQEVFLHRGLMEYGSIFGHGAYLGPDFTADYLHRSSDSVRKQLGGEQSDSARQETIDQFQSNDYDEETKTLPLSAEQATAFASCGALRGFFATDTTLRLGRSDRSRGDPQLTAFFAWSAWRPRRGAGAQLLLHQQLAAEDQVGTSRARTCRLVGDLADRAARRDRDPVRGLRALADGLAGPRPGDLTSQVTRRRGATPAQRATAWFFSSMAALFLLQTLVGGLSQHYRADLEGFFGIDIAQALPYNLVRTWHVQLAIFFVATSFVAAGIFLTPMIAGSEPRGQAPLAFALLGALAVVVFGSLFGELAGVHDWISGSIFGLRGSSTSTSAASGRCC